MTIYQLVFDSDNYRLLWVPDEADEERFGWEPGASVSHTWTPVRMTWRTTEDVPIGDLAGHRGTFFLSRRAVDALAPLLEDRVELLPVEVDRRDDFYALNVLRLSEALDVERSRLLEFEGDISRVKEHVFDPGRLVGESIFKLALLPEGVTYVTQAFRERVEEAGLTGFAWDRPVWSSEA